MSYPIPPQCRTTECATERRLLHLLGQGHIPEGARPAGTVTPELEVTARQVTVLLVLAGMLVPGGTLSSWGFRPQLL